jgi:acyl-CoA synthetase (NDP forming)
MQQLQVVCRQDPFRVKRRAQHIEHSTTWPGMLLQEEHKAAVDALIARAQEKANQMNDKKLTVEHLIMALAGNPRCVTRCHATFHMACTRGAYGTFTHTHTHTQHTHTT